MLKQNRFLIVLFIVVFTKVTLIEAWNAVPPAGESLSEGTLSYFSNKTSTLGIPYQLRAYFIFRIYDNLRSDGQINDSFFSTFFSYSFHIYPTIYFNYPEWGLNDTIVTGFTNISITYRVEYPSASTGATWKISSIYGRPTCSGFGRGWSSTYNQKSEYPEVMINLSFGVTFTEETIYNESVPNETGWLEDVTHFRYYYRHKTAKFNLDFLTLVACSTVFLGISRKRLSSKK